MAIHQGLPGGFGVSRRIRNDRDGRQTDDNRERAHLESGLSRWARAAECDGASAQAGGVRIEVNLRKYLGEVTMKTFVRCCVSASAALMCVLCFLPDAARGNQYKNFRVAVYVPVGAVERMHDPQWLESSWATLSSQVKIDKVYIETYRSRHIADEQLIEQVKKFFLAHGVQVAGGMALTGNDAGQFESFCYTDPEDREYVKNISAMTARHFDEIILDDFFFVTTKRDSDIAAKGSRSWTQFRLELMDEVARDLVLGPAKAANPKAKIIIKFPNWYEHFQGLGFDLEKEPKLFDGIYTGTETRESSITDQNLQQYESYEVLRYFENIKPGG